ncbi:GSG2 [Branchiostoma lanceolatum]|uniref:GSG2 protein n=1 Tax=Branchiostoma lanceolatum TaxID=7740 RepID=A0A8K0EP72_BRALA|nr:GSG2 [Branchiostoma lanceolatum]
MGKPSWVNNVTGSTVKKARVYTTKKNKKQIQYNTRVVDNAWEQVCKFNLGDISPFSLDSPEVQVPEARSRAAGRQGESPGWLTDKGSCREEVMKDRPCQDMTSHWNNRNSAVSPSPCSNKENSLLENRQLLCSQKVPTKKKSSIVRNTHNFDLDSDLDFVPSQPKKRKAPSQQQKKACSKKGGRKSRRKEKPSLKAPVKSGQYSSDFEQHSNARNLSQLNYFNSQESMNFGNSEDATSPTYSNLLGDASFKNYKSASSLYHNHNSYFDELVRYRFDQFVTRERKANTPLSFTSDSPFDGTDSKYQRPPNQVQLESPIEKCMAPVVTLSDISRKEASNVVLAEGSPSSSEVSGSSKQPTSPDFIVPESPIEQDSLELGTELSPEAMVFRTSTPLKAKRTYNLRKASKTRASGTRQQPARQRNQQSNRDMDAPPPKRHRAKNRNTEDDSWETRSSYRKKTGNTRTLRTRRKNSFKSVTPCSVVMPRLSEEDIQSLSRNKSTRRKQQSGNVRKLEKNAKERISNKKTTSVQQRKKRSTYDCFKTPKTSAFRAVFTTDATEYLSPTDSLDITPSCRGNTMVTPTSSLRAKSPGSGVKQMPLRGSVGIPSRKQSNIMSPLFKKALQNSVRMSPTEKLLLNCDQERILTFQECIPGAMMDRCVKIGEGVFGEVFRTTKEDGSSVALKIIPIEGDFHVNDEPQKTFEEILPEIVISRELSELQEGSCNQTGGFIHLHRVCLVQGAWPEHLLSMWDQWHKERAGGSENDKPGTVTVAPAPFVGINREYKMVRSVSPEVPAQPGDDCDQG